MQIFSRKYLRYKRSGEFLTFLALALVVNFDSNASIGSDYNWKVDPEVKKIRVIFSSIKQEIKSGGILLFRRQFNDKRCAIVTTEIGLSKTAHVRYFGKSIKERGLVITTEYYYDRNSKLRFVFIYYEKRKREGDRVYYDKEENIIFAVEHKGDNFYVFSGESTLYRKDSAIGGFVDENAALKDFRLESDCKETQNKGVTH